MRILNWMIGVIAMLSSCASNASISIEVNANKQQYRLVITTPKSVEINLWELEKPTAGLAPRKVFVVVKDVVNNSVHCGDNSELYFSSSKSSDIIGRTKALLIQSDTTYESQWFEIRELFTGLKQCANEKDSSRWSKFQIGVELNTNSGVLKSVSDWLEITSDIKERH
ncbi:MAG: hypothetical protein K2P84_08400 [Undibacterium sp.]|nr:hypothetical protein [Undibacterium sp.]